jgi:Mor family transcriptional regulator
LEEEKYQRELQGLKHNTELNKSFSYSLSHTTDRIREINNLYDKEFIFLFSELNEIFDLFLKEKHLTPIEKEKINLLKYRNYHQRLIYAYGRQFSYELIEFESQNEPKENDYEDFNQYINAKKIYPDTLSKHVDILLSNFKKNIEEHIEEVNNSEKTYIDMINK